MRYLFIIWRRLLKRERIHQECMQVSRWNMNYAFILSKKERRKVVDYYMGLTSSNEGARCGI